MYKILIPLSTMRQYAKYITPDLSEVNVSQRINGKSSLSIDYKLGENSDSRI